MRNPGSRFGTTAFCAGLALLASAETPPTADSPPKQILNTKNYPNWGTIPIHVDRRQDDNDQPAWTMTDQATLDRLAKQKQDCEEEADDKNFQTSQTNTNFIEGLCHCGKAVLYMADPQIDSHCENGTWVYAYVDPNHPPMSGSYMLRQYASQGCKATFEFQKPVMTNDSLEKLLFDKNGDFKIATVDDLIEKLPRELKADSIATRSTLNGHAITDDGQPLITPSDPGIYLNDPTGEFTLGYTGCPAPLTPENPECNRLVWQFWDPKTGRKQWRTITLPGKGAHLPAKGPGHAAFAQTPDKCMNCHGDGTKATPSSPREGELRSISDPYNAWNHVYGSISRAGKRAVQYGSPEYNDYLSFIDRAWTHPEEHRRYTALSWYANDKTSLLAELDRQNHTVDQYSGVVDPVELVHGTKGDEEGSSAMNKDIDYYDSFRTADHLASSPQYENYKLMLLGLAGECAYDAKDLAALTGESQGTMQKYVDRASKQIRQDFDDYRQAVAKDNPINFQPAEGALIGKDNYSAIDPLNKSDNSRAATYAGAMLYLAEKMGLPPDTFGTSLRQPYNYGEGSMSPSDPPDFLTTLFGAMKKCDHEIGSMAQNPKYQDSPCSYIEKASRAKLGRPFPGDQDGSTPNGASKSGKAEKQ